MSFPHVCYVPAYVIANAILAHDVEDAPPINGIVGLLKVEEYLVRGFRGVDRHLQSYLSLPDRRVSPSTPPEAVHLLEELDAGGHAEVNYLRY